ncbi:alpha/beta fold hydrolase [Halobacillus kuroshimensis]|uniref:Alpha/beta fold hydrolase n=1 Tax=Halobacillus kuroshimensis TaxID=302481 RepID=A0ABS3DVQ5_9BACI|nr:alpha/beta fold hydrolase [Halobacillus kuroshimensis]MBN8235430.1 alpha/beta fold hydrolase [Halobacillus kuroshimensis]
MKIKQPQPFTFEGGDRAVLLLHGFTGHSADVRMLGRFLQKHGYTTHAPIYAGHGREFEALLDARPEDWWNDVQEALNHLRELGYKEIAVAGLSLGGVLGLKTAYSAPVKGLVTMCSPVFFDNEKQLTKTFEFKARQYKQLEGKDEETIEKEIQELLDESKEMFTELGGLINEVHDNIDQIYTPTFVVQGTQDDMINTSSADYIYEQVETDDKQIKWYENSGHVITMDKEKEELHEDILQFLNSLDWS